MRAPIAVVLFLTVAPSILAAPRIAFDRVLPAVHDLGGADDLAIVQAIGDNVKVEAFIEHFAGAVNQSPLRMRDARAEPEKTRRAEAFFSIKTFTCQTRNASAEGGAYDVDGKRVRKVFMWVDATCVARIDVVAGKQRSSFYVRGEGTSPRVEEITDDMRDTALELAARYAGIQAAERIMPRRVRESIALDETAPAFEEGYALIVGQQFAAARETWTRAIRQQPRSASLHYNLAAVSEALGDRKAAEQHYVAARQLAPDRREYASELRLFQRRGSNRP